MDLGCHVQLGSTKCARQVLSIVQSFGETEISQLKNIKCSEKDVSWFDISMDNMEMVQMFQGATQLVKPIEYQLFRKTTILSSFLLNSFSQVSARTVFHNEEEAVVFVKPANSEVVDTEHVIYVSLFSRK